MQSGVQEEKNKFYEEKFKTKQKPTDAATRTGFRKRTGWGVMINRRMCKSEGKRTMGFIQ